MAKKKEDNKKFIKIGVAIGAVALIAIVIGVLLAIFGSAPTVSIEYTGEKKSAKIVINGHEEEADVPTVEVIDNSKAQTTVDEEEHGLGAWYNIDVTTPNTVKDSTLGRCINIDNYAGAQCWDLSSAVAETQTGRRLSTCGTGAASGMMNCWENQIGDDYDVIWDATQIRPGDILVFGGGMYGHTGIAMGYYNDGYVTLLGQNQGGEDCYQGGSSTNIINMSTRNFIGAYRWKAWNYLFETPPEPEPIIPITGCLEWAVEKYDTMSGIMLACEGTVVYGDAMLNYADSWTSRIIKPGQTVLQGWRSASGVGLYESDIIDHNI